MHIGIYGIIVYCFLIIAPMTTINHPKPWVILLLLGLLLTFMLIIHKHSAENNGLQQKICCHLEIKDTKVAREQLSVFL